VEKKSVGIMVCVLAMVLIAGVAEAQDITTDLIAHWKLDETSGITAPDSVGSNHGTLVGSPVWAPDDGVFDGAIDFPVAGEEHHVDCGNDTSLDITGSLTVSAWVRVDNWNGTVSWNRIVSKGGEEGSYDLMRNNKANSIRFGVYTPVSEGEPYGAVYVDGTVDVVTDGLWHLVTGVYDNPTGVVFLYIDGVLDNSATFTPDIIVTPNDYHVFINGLDGELVIGKRHFDGRVDDVCLYNRALTADDVAYMYSLPNLAPQVDAGTFQSALVDTMTQLDATVIDDGKPTDPCEVTFTWSQLSGLGTATFSPNPNIEDPCVSFDAVGVYELQLSASDSERDACDVLTVHVRATDDPVAYWDFETGSGTNVVDRTVNNNFGTFAGDPEPNWVTPGWIGDWALGVVDGSYVAITTDPAMDPNLNTMYGAVTISAWVKVDNWPENAWTGIVTKGNEGEGGVGGWSLMRNGTGDSLVFYAPDAGTAWGSVSVGDGYWHHVAGVHNGTTISLYVDGLLDISEAASGLVNPNTAEVWINGNSEDADRFLDGEIDDVRVYGYGLSAAQVADLAAMGALIPVVDAGADETFSIIQSDYLQLDATVTDDGKPEAAMLEWTSDPCNPGTVDFSNTAIEDPCVTFSAAGEYVLRLTVNDGMAGLEGDIYDDVTITVEDPTCLDVANDGLLFSADLSGPEGVPDCYIDLHDFAALAGSWLRCNNPQDPECEFPY
jgi:concanavalin A-like lectin/glucanase superfamily protein